MEQRAWFAPASAKKKRAIYVKINARLLHMQEQGLRTEATPVKLSQRNSQAPSKKSVRHTKPSNSKTTKRTISIKPIVISSESELESRENSSEAMSDSGSSSEEMEVKVIKGPNAGDVLDHEIKKETAPINWKKARNLDLVCHPEAHKDVKLVEMQQNPTNVFKRLGGKAAERTLRFKFGMSKAEAAQKARASDLSNIKCNLDSLIDPRTKKSTKPPPSQQNTSPAEPEPSERTAFDFSEPPTRDTHTKPDTLASPPPQPESDAPTEVPEKTSLPERMITESDNASETPASPPRPTSSTTPKKPPALKIRKAIRKPLDSRNEPTVTKKPSRINRILEEVKKTAYEKPLQLATTEKVHTKTDPDQELMDELDAYIGKTSQNTDTDADLSELDSEYDEFEKSWYEAASKQ